MITSVIELPNDFDEGLFREAIYHTGLHDFCYWEQQVLADPRILAILLRLIGEEDQRLAWRCSWIIDHVSVNSPHLLADKLQLLIIPFLSSRNSSLLRHLSRILCQYTLPESYLGSIINRSYDLITSDEPVAVRVNTLQLLFNLTRNFPELKGELIAVLERLLEEQSSGGLINRSNRLLSQLRS
jgi:hypothetical protein